MIRRLLPAVFLTVLATTFSFGLILSAHQYTAAISSATEGASLLSALLSPSREQLARSSGPGGDGCGGCGGGTHNGTNGSGSPSKGGGTTGGTANHDAQ